VRNIFQFSILTSKFSLERGETMELSRQEFDLLRDYIHSITGLAISDNKAYLIRQRLEPLVSASGCTTFSEFHQKLKQSSIPLIQEKIINAITTNETCFFRDEHPFAAFKDYILPRLGELIRQRKSRSNTRKGAKTRFWSAGSSSGQEPYSLAMLIQEYAEANRHLCVSEEDFGILATDIASKMLAKAMDGEYSEAEIRRGISSERMAKYFRKDGSRWIINSNIRSMVEFRQINLIRPFTMLGGFDMIFCRNVLIYFNIETKTRIIGQFCEMLSDNGFLVLGSTENVYALSDRFDSVNYGKTLLYRKKVRSEK